MRFLTLGTISVLLLSSLALHAQPIEPDPIEGADSAPYIRSALPLDEPRHLCIDLPGHGASPDTDAPFTVHTCKDGMWNYNQRFRWNEGHTGLRMPQYGKCLAAAEASAGADVVLADCGSPNAQILSVNARLTLKSDPTLWITIPDVTSELTPGGKRFPERFRSRPLSLELCSDAAMERQLWSVTQQFDLEKALLPPAGSLPVTE